MEFSKRLIGRDAVSNGQLWRWSMKSLVIAFLVVVIGCILVAGLLQYIGVAKEFIAGVAGGFFAAIQWVHRLVERKIRSGSAPKAGVVPLQSYTIRTLIMLVYATFAFVLVFEISSLLSAPAAALASSVDVDLEDFVATAGVLAFPMVVMGVYIVSRWVGIRAGRVAFWVAPSSLVLGRLLDYCLLPFLGENARTVLLRLLSQVLFNPGVYIALMILILVALFGAWRGSSIRRGVYFNQLLSKLPRPSQEALLELVYEESRPKNVPNVATA